SRSGGSPGSPAPGRGGRPPPCRGGTPRARRRRARRPSCRSPPARPLPRAGPPQGRPGRGAVPPRRSRRKVYPARVPRPSHGLPGSVLRAERANERAVLVRGLQVELVQDRGRAAEDAEGGAAASLAAVDPRQHEVAPLVEAVRIDRPLEQVRRLVELAALLRGAGE